MEQYKLSSGDVKKLNQVLTDCEAICADLDRAEKAGVPNVQYLRDACNECRDNAIAIKQVYAPGAK